MKKPTFTSSRNLTIITQAMNETAHITYLGDLRTKAIHLRSGIEIITDAPVDNQGKGEAFSPTDLAATALGSCMVTIMGIAARTHNFNIDGTTLRITKIMTSSPRRIGEVLIEIDFPPIEYNRKIKNILQRCADTCPVALSLHPELKQTVKLNFKS